MKKETQTLLREYAKTYETAQFLKGDPSWFMHQVTGQANRETTAFIASCLSYGNRKLFMPKIQQLIDLAQGNLHEWITEGNYRKAFPDNGDTFYRLQTFHHMRQLFDGLAALFQTHHSLGIYFQARQVTTAMEALVLLTEYFSKWDVGHLVPHSTASSCKRLCMFLRWMVRTDSPIDLGLWTFIAPQSLLMPLDTHVLHEAMRLKLIDNKTASMRTVIKLTEQLLLVFPDDPLKGDFALFGYGMMGSEKSNGK
ncbi:TIGR02757 family protein [Prevotella sp.]|uniref:TIGR02757 family protein n=1 Tax=Prevotella sp. TaxID=59823 RepID=UPI002F94703C